MDVQCRICLDIGNSYTSLFTTVDGISLSQIIQFCANVQIAQDDEFPSYACPRCCKDATFAYMFVKKCRQSDSELRTQQILRKLLQSTALEEKTTTSDLRVEIVLDSTEVGQELCGIETLDEHVAVVAEHISSRSSSVNLSYHPFRSQPHEDGSEYEVEDGANEELLNLSTSEDHSEKVVSSSTYHCCNGDCVLYFPSKNALRDHIHTQHSPSDGQNLPPIDRFRCENCGQHFSTHDELAAHEWVLRLKRSMIRPSPKARPISYQCLFTAPVKKCCDCSASFPTIEELLVHAEQLHSVRKTVQDPSRPVRCELCFKLFRSELSLRKHQNMTYKARNYGCSTCEAFYSTPSQLATHEFMHIAERKYVCEVCGASFKKEQNLKMHSLLHREKKEVCNTCGLRFHRKSNLRMHQRIHSEAYYTVCPECGKQYKNRSQLKEHLKVHTKEKPMACRYCPRRFSYCSDRKRHEMTHTGDYPFVCGCSKKFSRNSQFVRHTAKCNAGVDRSVISE